jgi:hypothetical protein
MYEKYSYNHIAVGVFGGIFTILLILALIPLVLFRDASAGPQSKLNIAASFVAVTLAMVSLSLVSAWAYEPYNEDDREYYNGSTAYLGEPQWKKNVFAWHPVFMVAGFFFSQALAIISQSIMPNRTAAAVSQAFWQCGAVATLISGLCAITAYKARANYQAGKLTHFDDSFLKSKPAATRPTGIFIERAQSLTSLHSWVGVVTVVTFGLQFLFGGISGLLDVIKFDPKVDLKGPARHLSLAAFGLSALTIVSGIVNYLPSSACNYVPTKSFHQVQNDPARQYNWLPNACKIANGLGLSVLFTAIAVFYAVSVRVPYTTEEEHGVVEREKKVAEVEAAEENTA